MFSLDLKEKVYHAHNFFSLLHHFVIKGIPLIHKGSSCTICGSLFREAPSYKLISDSELTCAFQDNYLYDIASSSLTTILLFGSFASKDHHIEEKSPI